MYLFKKRSVKTLGVVVSAVLAQRLYDKQHSKTIFKNKIKLVFPEYRAQNRNEPHSDNNIEVVSKTQLEYVIKTCN